MSLSEFSALRQIINSTLDTYEAELGKLNITPPGLLDPTPHPLDDPSFLPGPKLYYARENLVAALGMMTSLVQHPVRRLWMLGLGHHTASSLNLVAETDVPNILLEAGPEGMSSIEIASKVNISEAKLVKILRLLANQHIFRETKAGYFAHTRTSLPLTRGNPAHYLARDQIWLSLKGAPYLAEAFLGPKKSDSQAPWESPLGLGAKFEELGATGYFDWLARFHPKRLDGANRLIAGYGGFGLRGLLADIPWPELVQGKTIVDVGGGNGALLLPLLQKYPDFQGIIQEIAQTARQAKENFLENLPEAVSSGRVTFEEHDFFTPQPHQGSGFVYVLRHIIHNWPDELSLKILAPLKEVMNPDSRLLIIEQVSKPVTLDTSDNTDNNATDGTWTSVPFPLPISLGVSGHPDYCVDFEMMTVFNALDRTQAQYDALIRAAGLRIVKIWPARGPNSVIEVAL